MTVETSMRPTPDVPPRPRRLAVALLMIMVSAAPVVRAGAATPAIGARGQVGCGAEPRRVQRLSITKPGVYENILVDGEWTDGTLVKIVADGVTLRNCEIRNGTRNAVTVYARDVVIDSCRIHHALAGTYDDQDDAHGITGRPTNLTIRNCDIGLTSGDSIQFDPGRGPWDNVLVEDCTLWTAPLPEDAAGFKKGQRPGENAVDTKQAASNPRSRLTIRSCLIYGWNQPGQIGNMAALNLKNHVAVRVENCLLRDNEIGFRVRGGGGEYGGAEVTIDGCAVYDSRVAVRAESGIRDLKVRRLGLGAGVGKRLVSADGGPGPGYENVGEYEPPSFERVLESGLLR
jgi:hypothetical protein